MRLQLHSLAYNLGNFLRTLATPEPIKDWSLTSLKDKLIKIGAKVVSHGRYVVFQMAEVLSHLGFQPVQKTPTIHVSSGFIWGKFNDRVAAKAAKVEQVA